MLRAKDIGFIRIILLVGSKELEQIWNQKMKEKEEEEKKKLPHSPPIKLCTLTLLTYLFIFTFYN